MKRPFYDFLNTIDTDGMHHLLEAVKSCYSVLFEGTDDDEDTTSDDNESDDNTLSEDSISDDLPEEAETEDQNDDDEISEDDVSDDLLDENDDLGELTGNEEDSTTPDDVNASNGPTTVDAETLKKELLEAGIVEKVKEVAQQCNKKTLKDALPIIALGIVKFMKNKQYVGVPKDALKAIVIAIAKECKDTPKQESGKPTQEQQNEVNDTEPTPYNGNKDAESDVTADLNSDTRFGNPLMESKFKNLVAAGLIAASAANADNGFCNETSKPDDCRNGYDAGYKTVKTIKQSTSDAVDAIKSTPGKIATTVKGWFSSDDPDDTSSTVTVNTKKDGTKLDRLKGIGSDIVDLGAETISDAAEYAKDAAVATGRSTVKGASAFGSSLKTEMAKETQDNHW